MEQASQSLLVSAHLSEGVSRDGPQLLTQDQQASCRSAPSRAGSRENRGLCLSSANTDALLSL